MLTFLPHRHRKNACARQAGSQQLRSAGRTVMCPVGYAEHAAKLLRASIRISPPCVGFRTKNGNLKKEIVVDQVRELVLDAPVLPNESDRKVYIIEEADRMNLNAQNAALKLLEEPPGGVIFLLCVENLGLMLETVRSRCAVINVGGEAEEDEAGLSLANGLLKALDSGKPEELFLWIGKNEQSSTAAVQAFLDSALQLITDRLGGRTKSSGLTAAQLMKLAVLLEQCGDYIAANVGPKHVFSMLAAGGLALLTPEYEEG